MSTSDFEQERWTHAVPTPEGRTETAGKSCDEETRSRKRRRNAVEVTHAPYSSEPQAGKRRSESWHKIGSTDNGSMYLYCSAVSPVGDFKVFFQHRLGNLDRSGLQALISSPYLRQRQSSQDVEDGTVFHCSATRKGTGPIDVSLVKAPNLTCYHIASQPVNFYTHQTQAPCASKLRLKYVFLVGSKLVLVGEFPKKVASTRVVECVIQGSSGAEVIEVPKSSSTWTRQMITLKLPPTWDLPLDPSAHIRYTFHDHTRATSEARPIHLTLEL